MKKGFIIAAAVLVALGIVIAAGAFIASGFDFSTFKTENYVTHTYTADGDFDKIEIVLNVTDVDFKPSMDGKFSVLCEESEDSKRKVEIENGILKIGVDADGRGILDFLSLFKTDQKMTVYLPKEEYASLKVSGSTCDVGVSDRFTFGDAEIKTSTGDVWFDANVKRTLTIGASTGDVSVSGDSAEQIDISLSTGSVNLISVDCKGALNIKVTTGKTTLADVKCLSLTSSGSTGDITLKDTVATGSIALERSTGDVKFDRADGGSITVNTTTGDVTGTLLTEKVFITKTSTGDMDVPESLSGGKCAITTTTGDIEFSFAD